jgi:hypothetical protein
VARGRGVFRSLVAYRAALAKDPGHRYLQVDAAADSQPILQRLGFAEIAKQCHTGTFPASRPISVETPSSVVQSWMEAGQPRPCLELASGVAQLRPEEARDTFACVRGRRSAELAETVQEQVQCGLEFELIVAD